MGISINTGPLSARVNLSLIEADTLFSRTLGFCITSCNRIGFPLSVVLGTSTDTHDGGGDCISHFNLSACGPMSMMLRTTGQRSTRETCSETSFGTTRTRGVNETVVLMTECYNNDVEN